MSKIYVASPDEWLETFVVTSIELSEAQALAGVATSYLIERGLIEANPWRNFAGPIGHAAGPDAESILENPADTTLKGLVEIWASGEGIIVLGKPGGILMRCPTCRKQQGFTLEDIQAWEKTAHAASDCIKCGRVASLDRWDGERVFAYARLTISFTHWPILTEKFRDDLQRALGNREIIRIPIHG